MSDISKKTHTFRQIQGLRAVVDFSAGKTVADDLPIVSVNKWEDGSGILFTDGTALIAVLSQGFAGSDVTPPDPVEIAYYTAVPQPLPIEK